MTDSRAEDILREQGQMEGARANWEPHWQECAERVLPRQQDFQTKRLGGEKLTEKVFDSTAPLALDRFGAAMESMLTPRTQRWHELTAPEELADDEEVKRYLYALTSLLFRARYAPKANFASQAHETYIGLGAFGTGAMFVDDDLGVGIRYRAIPLAELYIAENFQGVVDKVHRKFELTARQARKRFGDELPETIQKAAEKEPERKFEFVHCFKPREDAAWSRMDYRGMAFASYYLSFEGRKLLREGGYRTMRYAVSRYVTAPREVYGRSPAMQVLADIKTANAQAKTNLRVGELIADPPLLLADDGALTARTRPGSLNYGALGPEGQELMKPLQTGANLPVALEMQEASRRIINDAFLVTLFQILVETPNMTATEAMLRAQEKGALLAPTAGRQQSELLGPMIQAEIDILAAAGALPEMPEALAQMGGETDIAYTSPIMRAQRAEEGVAILRTLEGVAPLAQVDPSVMRVFKGPEIARELGEINGMDPKLLMSPEELSAKDAAEAQAQNAAALLSAAPVAASAAKDLAAAQSMMAGAPGQAAPAVVPA